MILKTLKKSQVVQLPMIYPDVHKSRNFENLKIFSFYSFDKNAFLFVRSKKCFFFKRGLRGYPLTSDFVHCVRTRCTKSMLAKLPFPTETGRFCPLFVNLKLNI